MSNLISNKVRKYFLGAFIALTLVVAPFVSQAITVAELQAQIAALTAQLAAMIGQNNIPPTVVGRGSVGGDISLVYEGNVQKLRTMFDVEIGNQSEDSSIYIPKSYYALVPSFFNKTRDGYTEAGCYIKVLTSDETVVHDTSGKNSYYKLGPRQLMRYVVTKTCSIDKMLSGDYIAKLGNITWATTLDSNVNTGIQLAPTNLATSKSQLIIGEQTPWLESAKYTGDKDGVVITGERLSKVSKIYFAGQAISKEDINWISDSQITIVPSTRTPGYYPIYTESYLGSVLVKSNTINVYIPSTSGQVSINSVSGPTTLNVNQTGTWSITVTAPSDAALTYSVDWGEKGKCGADAKCLGLPTTVQQTSTFTHSYVQAGTYTVNFIVYAKGIQANSSSLTVNVGSPISIAKPVAKFTAGPVTLTKDLKNPTINATFTGTVSAVGGDVYLYKNHPIQASFFKKETGDTVWTNNCAIKRDDYGANLPTIVDKYGNTLTIIKNGTSAKYGVYLSCPINEMFAGVYGARLTNLVYSLGTSGSYEYLPLDGISPNTQYIVGEKGPYISSATFNSQDRSITLIGERLSQMNSLKVGSLELSGTTWLNGYVRKTDTKVIVRESKAWPTGLSNLQIGSAVGQSNSVSLLFTGTADPRVAEFLAQVYALIGGVQRACGTNPSVAIPTEPTVPQLQSIITMLVAQIQACTNSGAGLSLTSSSASFTLLDNGTLPAATATVQFIMRLQNTSNNVAYISATPADFVGTSTTAMSGRLSGVHVNPTLNPADTTYYYVIPPGDSRTITLEGMYGNSGAISSGLVEFKITKIYFGTSPSNLRASSISEGLNALRVSAYLDRGYVPPVTPVTPTLSNLVPSDSANTWTQGTTKTFTWQTAGSIPNVDVLLCAVGGSCYYSQKNIANTGSANVSVVSTPIGSSVKVMVRESGKTTPSATSPNLTITSRTTSTTTVSQAKINELASVLNAIKALLAQMEGN